MNKFQAFIISLICILLIISCVTTGKNASESAFTGFFIVDDAPEDFGWRDGSTYFMIITRGFNDYLLLLGRYDLQTKEYEIENDTFVLVEKEGNLIGSDEETILELIPDATGFIIFVTSFGEKQTLHIKRVEQ